MDQLTQQALEEQNPWWFNKEFETGINRLIDYPKLEKNLNNREILVILGARRCGKSTILYQLIKKLLEQKAAPKNILLMNLDEPLFQSKKDDPSFLTSTIDEAASKTKTNKFYILIDEIQNNNYWAAAAKILYDTRKDYKIILTGSASTLLLNESATRLSGRYFTQTIHPLTFNEYLRFKKKENTTLIEKKQNLEEYLRYGGFPRPALEEDPSSKEELLKNYFQTIYLKDIINPNKIKNNQDLYDLLYYLISNTAKPCSYQKLSKTLSLSVPTVKEYINLMENAYLLYTVNKYDPSVRKQQANNKKIYCLDTGLINAVAFQFTENRGRLLENLVYNSLKRKNSEAGIYYHKDSYECDFLIRENRKITGAIQVTESLKPENEKREIRGLIEALKEHRLEHGTIITFEDKKTIKKDNHTINIIPAYEWLK